MNKKATAAGISVISNIFLTLLKLSIGLMSGAISILSEAIHSAMDLLASLISFFAVRIASKAPDNKHPYGHGKFENVSGVVEGLLILIAAIWIIFEAIDKIIHPHQLEALGWAAGVMFFSALLNFFVSKRLYKVAKETNSIALEADALHLKTDIYTSIGIGIGIAIVHFSGWLIFDPLFAILVALFIIKEGVVLIKKAFNPLLDTNIRAEEKEKFNLLIEKSLPSQTHFEALRVRQNGAIYILDFILKVPSLMSVQEAHDICDQIEKNILSDYKEADIQIHIEPNNIS
jgi:cation diffusion facilitator family transporter